MLITEMRMHQIYKQQNNRLKALKKRLKINAAIEKEMKFEKKVNSPC
jgi:hypothetical protein